MGSTASKLRVRLGELQAGIETGAALRAIERAGDAIPAEPATAGHDDATAGRVEGLLGRLERFADQSGAG
jgi:hypothetical protein